MIKPTPRRGLLWAILAISCASAACSDDTSGGKNNSPDPADMGGDAPPALNNADCRDLDGDGHFAGLNCPRATDCDDNNPQINPDAQEVCGDRVDNNCNDQIDESCPCSPGALRLCSSHGDPMALQGPEVRCKPGVQRCVQGAWQETCEGEVGPSAESCNRIDDDCDGVADNGVRNALGLCLSDLPDGWTPPREDCGPTGEGNGLDDNGDGQIDEGCSCAVPDYDPNLARKGQPCYGGPPSTLGVGVCKGGARDCVGGAWGTCAGQVLPSAEVCGDGLDNDCDGIIDNGCPTCVPDGPETCDGKDNDCDGLIDEGVRNACGGCGPVQPQEICGNGLDDNCDGRVDESCQCTASQQPCYAGPPEVAGVGACARGRQQCGGEFFGECVGSVLPQLEQCNPDGSPNGIDEDCDGQVDEGCGCPEGATRQCGSNTGVCRYGTQTCSAGVWGDCSGGQGPTEAQETSCDGQDNDCDGLTDEGLLNACGLCNMPCYTQTFDPTTVGDADNVDRIDAADPDNPRGKPGISLSRSTTTSSTVWVANTNTATASRINSDTNIEEARYWVGLSPSRTAVDLDGNMWVIGRNDGRVTKIWGNVSDCQDRNNNGTIETSSVVNGAVTVLNSAADPLADECVAYSEVIDPQRRSGRGVAVTPDGKVWFGFSIDGQPAAVKSIDPNTYQLSPTYPAENIPRFDRNAQGMWTPNGTASPRRVYGIIADSKGIIWMVDWDSRELSKFNPQTAQWEAYYRAADCGGYGIALDGKDRLWLGCWSNGKGGVAVFDPSTLAYHRFMFPQTWITQNGNRPAAGTTAPVTMVAADAANIFTVSALSVEPATGDVWATLHNTGLLGRLKINENDLAQSQWVFLRPLLEDNGNRVPQANGLDMRGIGFDRNGFAWHFGMQSEFAFKINPMTNRNDTLVPMAGAGGHYMYSDFTGSTLFSFTAPRATWRHVFDTEFQGAVVETVTIEAHVPPGTTLGMRVRPLGDNGLPTADWVPAPNNGAAQYAPYPPGAMQHTFDLRALGGAISGRQFELEINFTTTDRDVRPIIYGIDLGWQRP